MFGIIDHFQKVYMGKSNNNPNIEKSTFFSKSITQNIEFFKQSFQNSADLSVRYLNISGTQSAIITISGLVDKNVLTQSVVNPIIFCETSIENSVEKYKYIKDNIISSVDQTEVSTLEDAINKKDDCIVYSNCYDMEDVAREYAEQTGLLDSIPENLQSYFDFEAYGRDMSYEGQFVFTKNGNCVQIL